MSHDPDGGSFLAHSTPDERRDGERWPGLIKVEGSIGSTLIVGTDYRIGEIREYHEPSGIEGEPPKVSTVIRFDPVPSTETARGDTP